MTFLIAQGYLAPPVVTQGYGIPALVRALRTAAQPGLIDGFAAGDDVDVARVVSDIPAGQTLVRARLLVKRWEADPDDQALIEKVITPLAAYGRGHIADTGADGAGALVFQLTAADTLALAPILTCAYGIKASLSGGAVLTIDAGRVAATRRVVGAG
jgi:hypothetical protein